jgi:hypothetical protein
VLLRYFWNVKPTKPQPNIIKSVSPELAGAAALFPNEKPNPGFELGFILELQKA